MPLRTNLIRLAAEMPSGSPERKALLELVRTAGLKFVMERSPRTPMRTPVQDHGPRCA